MQEFFNVINTGGTIGILALIVWAVLRGDWVPGSQVKRERESYEKRLTEKDKECLDWRDRFFGAIGLTDRSIGLTEQAMSQQHGVAKPVTPTDLQQLQDSISVLRKLVLTETEEHSRHSSSHGDANESSQTHPR